jgi:ribosome biogenesis protein YTM1
LSYLAQRDLKKRRKIGEDGPRGPIEGLTDGDIGSGGWRRMPDGVLKGHKGRVGALGWAGKDVGKVVYSGGWDGSLRGWDVETGANVVVRVSFLFCFQLRSIPPLSFSSMDFKLRLTRLERLDIP